MFILRDYQEKAVKAGLDYINNPKNKKKPLIVAPVGAGKSLYIASIANTIKDPILVIQPNKELLEQNYNKYISYGNKASIYSASLKQKEVGHVTFATPMSIAHKSSLFSHVKVIIIDESHLQSNPKGALGKFLKLFPNTKLLGLTASPVLLTSSLMTGPKLDMLNRSRKSLWNTILYITQIKDIADKYWCKLKYESLPMKEDELEWNVSKSEYTEESMQNFYDDNNIKELIINRVKTLQDKQGILIFCPSIAAAKELQASIPTSQLITGLTPTKEREKLVKDFLAGKIKIMINVLVFSVGFDYPGLDCIIDASPTASVVRWYQKYGRGVRINPNNPNKECLFIDYANNVKRFGYLEDITFEDDEKLGWGMFSKDKILTGLPISEIGTIRKSSDNPISSFKMPFGKHKGKELTTVPESYLRWMLKDFTWNKYNQNLKKEIEKIL